MRKLVVLNPNTTGSMTDAVVAEARQRVPPGTEVVGMTPVQGCAVIDSRASYAIGAHTALAMLRDVPADADAILLACFGDPGLQELRRAATIPVVGLAEAVIAQIRAAGARFAIVTAGADWVAMLKEYAHVCGAADLLVDVHALAGNGRQLRQNPEAFRAEVLRLSTLAADQGAKLLVLGGAAFAGLEFAVDPRVESMDVLGAAIRSATAAVAAGTLS